MTKAAGLKVSNFRLNQQRWAPRLNTSLVALFYQFGVVRIPEHIQSKANVDKSHFAYYQSLKMTVFNIVLMHTLKKLQ